MDFDYYGGAEMDTYHEDMADIHYAAWMDEQYADPED